MAIVFMLQTIVHLLSDVGLRQAVIHNPNGHTSDVLNTAWTIQIIRGFVIWSVCLLLAVGIQTANALGYVSNDTVYGDDVFIVALVATTFASVISGFNSTKTIEAERNLELKRLSTIDLVSQIIALGVVITMALYTATIWPLIIGNLVSTVAHTTLTHTYLSGHTNSLRFNRRIARELLTYGKWVLFSSMLFVAAANGDRLILGGLVDSKTLGLYAIALTLLTMITGLSNRLFGSVIMPALAEASRASRSAFDELYRRFRAPFDIVLVGSSGVLFATGATVIAVLYDARYHAAGELLEILSLSLVFARWQLNEAAYLALGRPSIVATLNGVRFVAIYVTLPLAYFHFGLTGAVWAIALHTAAAYPVILWQDRQLGISSFAQDALTSLAWPLGYVAGWGINVVWTELMVNLL